MSPSITYLANLYNLLTDRSESFITGSLPSRGFFSSLMLGSKNAQNQLWISIQFGFHEPDSVYTQSVRLRVYDPHLASEGGECFVYLDLQACGTEDKKVPATGILPFIRKLDDSPSYVKGMIAQHILEYVRQFFPHHA